MKKKLLFLLSMLCMLPLSQLQALTLTYTTPDGITWKFSKNGTEATIEGTTQGNSLTGALNIPGSVEDGGVNYTVTTIGDYAFSDYTGITSLNIPHSVKSIEQSAFSGCANITGTLVLPNSLELIYSNAFSGCSGFSGPLVFPTSLKHISDQAFFDCGTFTGGLTIPNGVLTIGNEVFSGCQFSGHLSLPNSLTWIGDRAFNGCRFTGPLVIPTGLNYLLFATFASNNFSGDLVIPANITTIGENVFASAGNFKTITFDPGPSVSIDNQAFRLESSFSLDYIDISQRAAVTGGSWTPQIGRSTTFQDIRKNALVYLPSNTNFAANDDQNLVIDNVCNNLVINEREGVYESLTYFVNKKPFTASKVTYIGRRGFRGPYCATVCLPYPATLPAGMTAYEIRTKVGGGKYYRFASISNTQLEANKPYLVRITDGDPSWSQNISFGTDVNVQIPVTPANIEIPVSNDASTFFCGSLRYMNNATAAANNVYNLNQNQWRPVKTTNTSGYMRCFRAYIRTTGPAPAKGFAIVLDDEDSTTGIDTAVENEVEQGNSPIYTLDGKLMGTDIDALPSGEIYVKNGKKFYKF